MVASRHSRRVGATNAGPAAQRDPGEQDDAGEQEPGAGHEERRDGLDRDRDGEVGRAPHDVQDEHPEGDPSRGSAARRGDGFGLA